MFADDVRHLMEAEDYARFESAAEQLDEIGSQFEHSQRFTDGMKSGLVLAKRDATLLRRKFGHGGSHLLDLTLAARGHRIQEHHRGGVPGEGEKMLSRRDGLDIVDLRAARDELTSRGASTTEGEAAWAIRIRCYCARTRTATMIASR